MAKMGRPLIEIDWDTVDRLCADQCTATEIAANLGISIDTLERATRREKGKTFASFADYFKEKRQVGYQRLRSRQFVSALQEGNPTMLIWLGKQYLGQSDDVVGPETRNLLGELVRAVRAPLERKVNS